ncbi:hypothetical protein LOK49_LG02G00690 [Camellia lanceoleosa]|uniref:Uncharacterized protein n=1 Tax=Camellia lanceoleosa TaxID=1840588 RepID=A0ACC0INB8_9ERIC|nr:hypothetical protein LOK49_LG02G00690 [Camellia lanceoleosa]
MHVLQFSSSLFVNHDDCSTQECGVYINRERGYSIDPIYIDDPLFPTNNVGRNCFRIHQCIKLSHTLYRNIAIS